MERRYGWQLTLVMAVTVVLSGVTSTAMASGDSDVAVLLTEVTESGVVGDDDRLDFWWSGSETPQWTMSDEIVFDALREAGVDPAEPERLDISRIYRRPGLSTENAAQLGSLLDAERVLVGEIQYLPIGRVAPLGYRGVEARAEVTLVPAGNADGVALDRFSITRRVYGEDGDEALSEVRQKAGQALGEVLGQSLHRSAGQIGGDGEAVLALRNVERAENLEAVRQRLVELDEVDGVAERWATEGLIALEIESANGDSSGVLDYAADVLEHHEFEEFRAVPSSDPVTEGVTELWLEPLTPAR